MHELTLLAPRAMVDAVSDVLSDELEALSVTVEDADADGEDEQALFGEPGQLPQQLAWNRSTVKALFEGEEPATAAATLLLAQPWTQGLHVVGLSEVEDADWVRLTQAQFEPVPITDEFWIVPSWHEPPPQARLSIRLDPGLAFGTGTHPTTRMCLRWIARQAAQKPLTARVLDYGCGSGILAIAAALHGAIDVTAVDIDPAAVEATVANARNNHVGVVAMLPHALHDPSDQPTSEPGYDIVLANILATPLTLLAPLLAAQLQPGGHIVLAGILERQAAMLQSAYREWIDLQVADQEEGWILMTGQRRMANETKPG